MRVRVSTELPIAADAGFELLQRSALLRFVMGRLVTLGEMPERWTEGTEVTVSLRFFGVLPAWPHTIRFLRCRDGEIYTNEAGGPVRRWNHSARFEPLGDGRSRYTDEIDIDAGPLTPLVVAWAQLQYRYRQRRWRELAAVLA